MRPARKLQEKMFMSPKECKKTRQMNSLDSEIYVEDSLISEIAKSARKVQVANGLLEVVDYFQSSDFERDIRFLKQGASKIGSIYRTGMNVFDFKGKIEDLYSQGFSSDEVTRKLGGIPKWEAKKSLEAHQRSKVIVDSIQPRIISYKERSQNELDRLLAYYEYGNEDVDDFIDKIESSDHVMSLSEIENIAPSGIDRGYFNDRIDFFEEEVSNEDLGGTSEDNISNWNQNYLKPTKPKKTPLDDGESQIIQAGLDRMKKQKINPNFKERSGIDEIMRHIKIASEEKNLDHFESSIRETKAKDFLKGRNFTQNGEDELFDIILQYIDYTEDLGTIDSTTKLLIDQKQKYDFSDIDLVNAAKSILPKRKIKQKYVFNDAIKSMSSARNAEDLILKYKNQLLKINEDQTIKTRSKKEKADILSHAFVAAYKYFADPKISPRARKSSSWTEQPRGKEAKLDNAFEYFIEHWKDLKLDESQLKEIKIIQSRYKSPHKKLPEDKNRKGYRSKP